MAAYRIDLTQDAKEDLYFYSAFERKLIISEVRNQLSHQPLSETVNRKELRGNPLATWELRVGKYRVFYDVDGKERVVTIVALGHKEHQKLLIRGEEVTI